MGKHTGTTELKYRMGKAHRHKSKAKVQEWENTQMYSSNKVQDGKTHKNNRTMYRMVKHTCTAKRSTEVGKPTSTAAKQSREE